MSLGVYRTSLAAVRLDAASVMLNLVSLGRLTPFSVKRAAAHPNP